MLTIQKNQPNFKIITKSRPYSRENEDIVISIANEGTTNKGGVRRQRVMIHFHNKSGDRVTKTTYVAFGIDGDRLYFIEADNHEGFKITKGKSEYNGTCQVSDESLLEWARIRRGSYTIHQDSKSGLHYIQAISEEKK